MKTHLFLPDAADLTGQACAVYGCNVKKSNAVHVTAEQLLAQVPAIDWYEVEQEGDEQ